ncbi:YfiT family bacillithiol transferase [Mucilaginibacter sp.]|uniref:YfiT family bacillithiol transferase n=1 Tax=Mucilaginibacter sp. TaxID=1882438 RepID=UPI003AFF9094
MTDERYPTGKYTPPASFTNEQIQSWVAEIAALPGQMRQAVVGLNYQQFDTPYRLGGWTIRQVIHHVADSHANALTRFKLALTEENPTIKPYREADWALLPDYKMPVAPSFQMIEGIHYRWAELMKSLTEEQWSRTFFHPGNQKITSLKEALGLYVWHGRHHLAHIGLALGKV